MKKIQFINSIKDFYLIIKDEKTLIDGNKDLIRFNNYMINNSNCNCKNAYYDKSLKIFKKLNNILSKSDISYLKNKLNVDSLIFTVSGIYLFEL